MLLFSSLCEPIKYIPETTITNLQIDLQYNHKKLTQYSKHIPRHLLRP